MTKKQGLNDMIENAIADAGTNVIDTAVTAMNKKYFIIDNFGGKFRICHEIRDEAMPIGDGKILVPQSEHDFHAKFANKLIVVGQDKHGNDIKKPKSDVWFHHPKRREYDRAVFKPNEEVPEDILNLWKDYAFKPVKGNCGLYLAHLHDNICQGHDDYYDYLLKWMAYLIQYPGRLGEVAVCVSGDKGVGKNAFADPLVLLFGAHAIAISDKKRVTSQFNGHLYNKVLLVCDEALYIDDKQHDGILKSLITGQTIDIEFKGVDIITTRNLLHLIILSNEDHFIPATRGERRYFVLKCSDAQKGNRKYWDNLYEQLEKDGGYSALLYHLLNVDLSNFNVRDVPKTEHLAEQVRQNLQGIEAIIFECLCSGEIPGRVDKRDNVWVRGTDLIAWATSRNKEWNLPVETVGRFISKTFPAIGPSRVSPMNLFSKGQKHAYLIPDLQKFRKMWIDSGRPAGDWEHEKDMHWAMVEVPKQSNMFDPPDWA